MLYAVGSEAVFKTLVRQDSKVGMVYARNETGCQTDQIDFKSLGVDHESRRSSS